mgnify:CR=1 FL=1
MIDSALFAGRFLRGINMNFMQRCMAFLQWMDQELAEEQDGLKRERESLLLRSSGSD